MEFVQTWIEFFMNNDGGMIFGAIGVALAVGLGLVMLLVIQRVKKAGIFLGNDKRSSVIHLHRCFKQQKQIVPASLRPVYCLTVRVGPIIFTDMN